MARVEPGRLTLSDGTPVTIRTAAAAETFGLFRSVLEEGHYTVQTPAEVEIMERGAGVYPG